ncbi:MAG: hypothetical protein NW208_08445 [Bryobacter sp.]|nr:hypothetical protein [Bryobacter sp.]
MPTRLACALVLLVGLQAIGQTVSTEAPILVEVIEEPGSLNRKPQLTMNSDRKVRGYVVLVEFLRDGKPAMTFALSKAGFSRGVWQKGQVIDCEQVAAPVDGQGQPLPLRATVDLVIFEDGSDWGPQRHKQSARLLGQAEGTKIYHSHMRQMLAKQGVSAVVEHLSTPLK